MAAKYPPDPIWLGSSTRHEVMALKPIRQVVPPDMHSDESVHVIDRMETQATQYESAKKYVQAADCLEQAINKRLGFLGERHPELLLAIERHIFNCNYWGMQCLHARQHNASLELLKKAQAMTEAELVPSFKRRIYLRAMTFNNLCCYFHARGKLNAALQCGDRALKIEQHYKDNKNTARMHLNMGVLLSFMERPDEAIEHDESAVAFLQDQENIMLHEHGWEGIHRKGADPALKVRYEETVSSLAVAYHNIGVEMTRVGRPEQALDFLTKACQVGERKLGPQHPSTLAVKKSFIATVQAHPPAPPTRYAQRSVLVMNEEKDSKAATATSFHVEQPVSSEVVETLPDIRRPDTVPNAKSARTPRQRKSFREMRTMEQLKGGGINFHIPPKLLTRRSRLKNGAAPDSHVGSPIIQQCVHGITPLSDLRSPLQSAEGNQGRMQSSHSSFKAEKKGSIPGTGEIPETRISIELQQEHDDPDAFSLPQIIQRFLDDRQVDVIKPTGQRLQAIAAMKGQMMQNFQVSNSVHPGSTGHSIASQREDDRSAGYIAPVNATRGLAICYVSTAKPVLVRDEAAVVIQRIARGFITRRRIRQEVEKVANRAATRLQRLFLRRREARKAQQQRIAACFNGS